MSRGDHTWPLHISYHRCPHCGTIIESRTNFQYMMGHYLKDLHCPHCGANFTLEEKRKPSFGPLIGEPQPPEFDWE